MKKILLINCLLVLSNVFAQSPIVYQQPYNYSDNLNDANNMLVRYWYYRWRLQNDFLIIGNQPGYSIPAGIRAGGSPNLYAIHWGDGTIWLGHYMVMLATENALLRYSNRYYDLLKNERELYYALQAFNRLDEQSDTYYDAGESNGGNGTPMPACKNGFFIRDDVPSTFLTTNYLEPGFDAGNPSTWQTTPEFDHFTSGKSGFDYYITPFFAKSCYSFLCKDTTQQQLNKSVPNYTHSFIPISHNDKEDLKDPENDGDPGHLLFAMSKDQVYFLLTGFASVIRALPEGNVMVDLDNDGNPETPFNFVEEARIHITNMIARLYGITTNAHDNTNTISCSAAVNSVPWVVTDPLFEKPGIGNTSLLYSPMLSKIWKTRYSSNNTIPYLSYAYVNNVFFHTNGSSSLELFLSAFLEPIMTTKNNHVNTALSACVETVSGGYPISYGFLVGSYLVQNQNRVIKHLYNITNKSTRDWHTYFVPLYCFLHNASPSNNKATQKWNYTRQDMLSQLSIAPCIGPYNEAVVDHEYNTVHTNTGFEVAYGTSFPQVGLNGWASPFRFQRGTEENIHGYHTDKGEKKGGFIGFFNGIDYMSLLNLYYLTGNVTSSSPSSLPFYHNLIDRYVNYDVSSNNTPMLGGFNSVTLMQNVTGSAPLDIQAGSFIHLKDGTHITASNASKHLFIKTFSCTNPTAPISGYELPVHKDSTVELALQTLRPKNNDYGFNEVFPMMEYDLQGYERENKEIQTTISDERTQFDLIQNKSEDKVMLYPNPTKSKFVLLNTTTNQRITRGVQLLGVEGKVIQIDGSGGVFDVSHLSPGIYMVHIQGVNSDKKLIVLP